MNTIDRTKPILVTGGSDYLASWIVKQLLDEGFEVRTTVRDLRQKEEYAHLTKIAFWSSGTLRFFEADLLKKGSFSAAMDGCELVILTSSSNKLSGITNAQDELIEPALKGTQNVLDSVNETESVKRVVFTSSFEAIYGDAIDIKKTEKEVFTEEHWNFSSSAEYQPHPYSKTIAEKLAWKIAGKQSRWDLLVINPGFIMGPSWSKQTDSASIETMIQMLDGKYKTGVPSGNLSFVDVRDVAKAHILAGFTPEASGRQICSAHERSLLDMADVIRAGYPQLPLPNRYVSKWLIYLFAPMAGYTRKYVKFNIGIDIKLDNSNIKKNLGIKFLPFEHTIADHVEQLLRDEIVREPS